MPDILELKLFTIKSEQFTVCDFLDVLEYFGLYEDWREKVSNSYFLLNEYKEASIEVDHRKILKWSEEFRYENDLLSTEDLTQWLSRYGLTQEDLEKYFIRQALCEDSPDSLEKVSEVTREMVFKEILFSGSLGNLLQSWQKRLFAWFSKNEERFKALTELNEHYKSFERETITHIDKTLWLGSYGDRLKHVEVHFYSSEGNDFEKAQEMERFKGFVKDLPIPIDFDGVKLQELNGPISQSGFNLWFKLKSISVPSIENDDLVELIEDDFLDEVWQTLKVKLLRVS
ncbi:MAG: hypothetical protein NE330_04890 [Lentisphaeraceae bacterium]|nr:hypothetical protein [Lentisphaeraceae bacterium]